MRIEQINVRFSLFNFKEMAKNNFRIYLLIYKIKFVIYIY